MPSFTCVRIARKTQAAAVLDLHVQLPTFLWALLQGDFVRHLRVVNILFSHPKGRSSSEATSPPLILRIFEFWVCFLLLLILLVIPCDGDTKWRFTFRRQNARWLGTFYTENTLIILYIDVIVFAAGMITR